MKGERETNEEEGTAENGRKKEKKEKQDYAI